MANEFKIKKGLIVTGASGGTVVDIQGSQGQLFSVTDNLSGSIFAVSDISGVPIFDVNSSGLSTFDGLVSGITPVNAANFATKAYVDGSIPSLTNYVTLNTAQTITAIKTFTENVVVTGAEIFINTDTAGSSLTWRESDSSITAGQLRGYANRGDIYLYDSGVKKTELSSQADSFIPALHIGGTTAATGGVLQVTGNATFTGSITTTSVSGISIDTGGNAILTLDGASGSTEAIIFKHSGTEVSRISHSNSTNLIFSTGSSVTTALTLDNSQNATFAGKATTPQTAATDSPITLTTKSYVDGLVTGVPVYKGTWDARTQAEGGLAGDGGNPNLRLAANKILGNYYIVSTAGSATPNGAGTQPDSWNVGDWCIFSDVTPGAGTDLWQKIDNTSVISGAGTGQKVTKWEGAGPSETLTDGPITFSTNDSTFAGTITSGNIILNGSSRALTVTSSNDQVVGAFKCSNNAISRIGFQGSTSTNDYNVGVGADGNEWVAYTVNSVRLRIDTSGNTTFAGTIDSGNIFIDNSGTPQLKITDSGNAGGGGASGKIIYANIDGNAIGLGYTEDITATSDFIISSDAGSTYGGYLGLNTAAIDDPSDIILDPKTNVYITKALGIGIKTPNDLLDVHNTATGAVDAQMNFTTADTGTSSSDGFRVGWNGTVAQMYLFEDADMRFATNDAEKMRITSAGGISFGSTGTAYGSVGQVLTSAGNASPTWTTPTTGTVTGSGTATEVAFWTANDTISSDDGLYWDNTNKHLGINDNTPGSRLKVVSGTGETSIYTVDIHHSRNDANVATHAMRLNVDLSGADTTTGDRINSGLYIDIDSSANGDSANEHRIYGVNSIINFTGFTDLARGGYFLAESNYTGGKTSQLVGVFGQAAHDANDAAGGVSNMYGVYGLSSIQDTGDVDNAFGVYGQVSIGDNRVADIGVTKAVEGEILIDKSTALNYGTMIGISSIIDNNEGSVPNFGSQYLFKGDYQGTTGSTAWGIYTEGDKNYFEGKIGIGTTAPDTLLDASGAEDGATAPAIRITNRKNLTDWSSNTEDLGRFEFYTDDTSGNAPYTLGYIGIKNDYVTGTPTLPSGAMIFATTTYNASGGAVERMRIDSAGNVGIGTTSPALQSGGTGLHIDATTSSELKFTNDTTGSTASDGTALVSNGNDFSINNREAGKITLGTSNSPRITILSAGNVGIGTTSPEYKLVAIGNIGFGAGGYNGGVFANNTSTAVDENWGLEVQKTSGVNDYNTRLKYYPNTGETRKAGIYNSQASSFSLYSDSNNNPNIIIPDGNVGIGTTSPDAILETSKEVDGNQVGALLTNTRQAGTADSVSLNFGLGRTADDYIRSVDAIKLLKEQQWTGTPSTVDAALVFSTVSNETVSERMRIDSAGAIKFNAYDSTNNTGTPTYLLGTDGSGNVVKVLGADIPGVPAGSGTLNTVTMWTPDGDTLGNSPITISGNNATFAGNITFGDSHFIGDDASDNLLIQSSAGENIIIDSLDETLFRINGSTKMQIKSSGNVGIGTTGPGGALDVVGTYLATLFRVSNTEADATTKYGSFMGRHYTNSEENITGMLLTSSSSATGGSVSIGGGISAANAVNDIKFYTALNNTTLLGTERMRINKDGNVGIGTSTPLAKLDIQGTQGQLFSVTDDLSGSIFAVSDISGVPILDVNSSGVITFGSYNGSNQTGTPTYILGTDASGNVVKTLSGGGTGGGFWQSSGNNIYNNNSGNVGVGTAYPDKQFSQEIIYYDTGTASQSGTTITGVGTTFTSAMDGKKFIFADGTTTYITAFTNTTTLTATTSATVASQSFSIYTPGVYMGRQAVTGNPPQLSIGGSGSGYHNLVIKGDVSSGTNSIPSLQIARTQPGVVPTQHEGLILSSSGTSHVFQTSDTKQLSFTVYDTNAGSSAMAMYISGITNPTTVISNLSFGEVVSANANFSGKVNIYDSSQNNESKLNIQTASGAIGSIGFETGAEVTGIISSNTDVMDFRIGDGVGISSHRSVRLALDYLEVFNSSDNSKVRLNANGDSYLNGGEVGINETSPSATLHLQALASTGVPFKLVGDPATSTVQQLIRTTQNYTSSTAWYNIVCEAANASNTIVSTFIVERDGDVRNINNSYGQISDSRLKENIQDATPKLDDIMKVKVKNFNFIGDELKQIGVVAQELEEVFPGLVKEDEQPGPDGTKGGVYKSVKYSVLVPILVKAMQEQQEIIEDLKTRITKLEN